MSDLVLCALPLPPLVAAPTKFYLSAKFSWLNVCVLMAACRGGSHLWRIALCHTKIFWRFCYCQLKFLSFTQLFKILFCTPLLKGVLGWYNILLCSVAHVFSSQSLMCFGFLGLICSLTLELEYTWHFIKTKAQYFYV